MRLPIAGMLVAEFRCRSTDQALLHTHNRTAAPWAPPSLGEETPEVGTNAARPRQHSCRRNGPPRLDANQFTASHGCAHRSSRLLVGLVIVRAEAPRRTPRTACGGFY